MMSDFLAYFSTYLPTPVRFCPNVNFQFYYMVSDFGKSTYLPKTKTSLMDVPSMPTMMEKIICTDIMIPQLE